MSAGRPIVALDGDDVTLRGNVGDCMSWPVQDIDAELYYANGLNRKPDKFPVSGAGLANRKQEIDPYNNAQEALRGWPRQGDDFGDPFPNEGASSCSCDKCGGDGSRRSRSGDKKGRKGAEKDPYMCELIAHKFLTEAIEARDAKKRDAEEQGKREKEMLRKLKGVKANRASQLRQINNGIPVEKDPLDLWKMPKFTKGAQPHLDTRRRKPKPDNEREDMRVSVKNTPEPDFDSLLVRPASFSEPGHYHKSPEIGENFHDEGQCMVHFDGIPRHAVTPPNNGITDDFGQGI